MSRVITFYSYKGGVGRTFALANIATLLAKRGKRILLMDWDLEAPGLHRYFQKHLTPSSLHKRGIIHLLHDAIGNPEVNWEPFVEEFNIEDGLPISIILSGDHTEDYVERVRTFSWTDFFENRGGGAVLERWREEWKRQFDYILLDSRTGITDTGGVCTILMPDILALVFTTNEQSFECGIQIVRGVQDSRRNLAVPRPPAAILPLLGRFDGRDEVDESKRWLDRFGQELKPFYDDWLPKRFSARQMLELTKIPYITKFTYGEPLPVLTHGISDPEFPGFYLENIAKLLLSDFRDAKQILAPDEASDKTIIAEFRAKLADIPIDEEVVRQALTRIEDEMGHEALPELLNEAGSALIRQGKLESAEAFLRKALTISDTHFGVDSSVIVSSLTQLAELLLSAERLEEAEEVYRRALVSLNDTSPSSNPLQITTYNNLALLLRDMGRTAEAEALYQQAINKLETSRELDAPSLITTYNNYASLLRVSNRPSEAERLYREALSVLEKQPRPDHRLLITTRNHLASTLTMMGKQSEAEYLYREALLIQDRHPRPGDPIIASTYNSLARLLRRSNRYDEAELVYREAISKFELNSRPGNRRSLINLYNNLAALLSGVSRHVDAEAIYRDLLNKLEHISRAEAPALSITYTRLADLLIEQGRFADAEAIAREGLDRLEEYLRPESGDYINLLDRLGKALHLTDRTLEAETIFERILNLLSNSPQTNERRLITAYSRYAKVLFQNGKLEKSEAVYHQLLRVMSISSRSDSLEHGSLFVDLGEVLMAAGKTLEAEQLFQRTLLTAPLHSSVSRRAARKLELLSAERGGHKSAVVDPKSFDTFIIHSGNDIKIVRQLASELKATGVRVWLDEWELAPGISWVNALSKIISSVASIIVCIGSAGSPMGLGEIENLLRDAVSSERPVIPVFLPGAPEQPEIYPFLISLTAVDFREGITKELLGRLVWGITGEKSDDLDSN